MAARFCACGRPAHARGLCRRCYNRERYRDAHPDARPGRWTVRPTGFCPHYPREQQARENRPLCPVAPNWAAVRFCFFEQRDREWQECAWYWRREFWLERRRCQRLEKANAKLRAALGAA